MATKRGKKPTRKVKTLKAKSVSAGKAKRVRGGIHFTKEEGAQQKLTGRPNRYSFFDA